MRDYLSITKALSDENRVRVLMALDVGELCVCQLIELLKLAPSTVSKHMSILRQAGLVEGEKDGKWVYYRLPQDAPKAAAEAIEWTKRHLGSKTIVKRDAKSLRAIMRLRPVEVCKKHRASRAVGRTETRAVAAKE